MNTPEEPLDDDKLQRFVDHELTEGEMRVVGRDVERSEFEQARVKQYARLGDLLREDAEYVAADFDADGLFDKIAAGVEADKSPRLELKKTQTRQRTGAVIGVAIAMAAAVTIAFMLRPPAPGPIAEHPMDDPRQVVVENDTPIIHVDPPQGSSVERVDWGANTGTVFEVEGDAGQPLAVVWIAEDAL